MFGFLFHRRRPPVLPSADAVDAMALRHGGHHAPDPTPLASGVDQPAHPPQVAEPSPPPTRTFRIVDVRELATGECGTAAHPFLPARHALLPPVSFGTLYVPVHCHLTNRRPRSG